MGEHTKYGYGDGGCSMYVPRCVAEKGQSVSNVGRRMSLSAAGRKCPSVLSTLTYRMATCIRLS